MRGTSHSEAKYTEEGGSESRARHPQEDLDRECNQPDPHPTSSRSCRPGRWGPARSHLGRPVRGEEGRSGPIVPQADQPGPTAGGLCLVVLAGRAGGGAVAGLGGR